MAALITCVVNLFVARSTQKAQRQQWLTERKQEAYVKFLDARQDMLNHVRRATNVQDLIEGRKPLLGPLRTTAITLIAPAHISVPAEKLYWRTKDLINPDNPVLWNPAMAAEVKSIREATDKLEELMKLDLAVDKKARITK